MTAKFWVGGTGTWDNSTTTHWSLASGGANGAAVPGAADTITFDAASGGGVVTVDATINGLTFQTLTCGLFTGTLDFSVNNPSITLGAGGVGGLIIGNGSGTRTIKLGSGTFTLKGSSNNALDCTTTTGLTYDTTSTATFNIVDPGTVTGGTQSFLTGGQVFTNNTLNVTSRNTTGAQLTITGNTTFLNLTCSGSGYIPIRLPNGSTLTITNPLAMSGSTTGLLHIYTNNMPSATKATMAVAAGSTLTWALVNNIAFTGTTVAAGSSFDGGNNSGATFTGPSGGGSSGAGAFIGN